MTSSESRGRPRHPGEPDDAFLIRSMLGGDMAAMRKLMDRYDRLVRYTIFRFSQAQCNHDPQWLDSVASATWMGFVRSMRRAADDPPRSVAAYVVQIARRQAATAARTGSTKPPIEPLSDSGDAGPAAGDRDAGELLADLEQLEALRACLGELDDDDRTLVTQLPAITERRWQDAATALGLQESTLRSRWKRTLDRLKRCLRKRSEVETLARGPAGRDL